MQGSTQDGNSMMTLDSTKDYLAEQTLQAGDAALYVPRRKDLAHPSAQVSGGRKLGAFALSKSKSQISKVSADEAERQKQARLAEGRRTVQDRIKQDRARKVTMARQYRAGEIPDIQIKLEDVVKPLQELALKDSIISKLMLDLLFKAILSLKGDREDERPFTPKMKEDMKSEILKMLGLGWSSDLIGALLKLAETAQLRIQSDSISKVCMCLFPCACVNGNMIFIDVYIKIHANMRIYVFFFLNVVCAGE